MPQKKSAVSSSDLILRWRSRRREILNALPPDLLAEFKRLGVAIRAALEEEARPKNPFGEVLDVASRLREEIEAARIPMSEHKKKLVQFLRDTRHATRLQIVNATGIPEGSLSQLLRDDEFAPIERGLWMLRKAPNVVVKMSECSPSEYKLGVLVHHNEHGFGRITSELGRTFVVRFADRDRTYLKSKAKLQIATETRAEE